MYQQVCKFTGTSQKKLEIFIKVRNKIEHRHVDIREVDALIFGECQALLYNYENLLRGLFGKEYALNESLVYSLQFSQLRTKGQLKASKSVLSKDIKNIIDYVAKYRSSLTDDVYNSQEYSIKLLQVPKVSNTNRTDLAIEFVKFDELSDEDKELYNNIAVLVKDRKIRMEGSNVGCLKPGKVVDKVNDILGPKTISQRTHRYIYTIFNIRPAKDAEDPFETNTDYCHYDEAHGDYVYNDEWVKLIVHILQTGALKNDQIRENFIKKEKLDINNYEP